MAGQLATSRRFLVYGLGSGRGHATRTAALCVELRRLGAEVRLLVSAGKRSIVEPLGVEPAAVYEVGDAPERTWQLALHTFEPSDCVVDTFPEGLYGELDPCQRSEARWIALLRCRRDSRSPALLASLARYALVFDLEPELAWAPPIALPFGSVVRPLRAAKEPATDVLVVATEARQRPFLQKLAAQLERAGARIRCVPALDVSGSDAALLDAGGLAGARVVVGPAGYNLTYELSALGVWHLALPAAREYDDQARRAQRVAAVAHAPPAVERRVRAWLDQGAKRPRGEVREMRELASALLS